MAKGSAWPTIHAEREALAADLQSLTDEQWATPSLCAGWSVRQVVGHLTATNKITPPTFLAGIIGSGFRFNTMVAKAVARETAGTTSDTLARFKDRMPATTHPPGPLDTMLGESIIHAEDIRRPLGITRDYPTEAVARVADFYKGSNLIVGSKKRIAGLSLRADDAEWSTGSGPLVSGPLLSLLLAMTGRTAALTDLSGDGVDTLKARF
ncbi:MAG: maleylpyruvate isomerase family mycothiol-dependent enzyme [Acidimicrobiales bacterium]